MSKDLYFEHIEDFVDYIVCRAEDNEELFLSVVGRFEEVKDIIKEFIVSANAEFDMIDIQSPDFDGYMDEYVLDCWCDDGLLHIGCEPARRDGKYLNFCGDETYLLSNCSSKLIPLCDDSELYFVNIGEGCECDEDCCGCCECACHEDEDDVTYYVINGLTEMDILSILEGFGF